MAPNLRVVGRRAIIVMVDASASAQSFAQTVLSAPDGDVLAVVVWIVITVFVGALPVNIERVKAFMEE